MVRNREGEDRRGFKRTTSDDRKNLSPKQAETLAKADEAAGRQTAENLRAITGRDPERPVPGSEAWARKKGFIE